MIISYDDLNMDFLRLWVKELLSGQWTQGFELLEYKVFNPEDETETTHNCCLGVACRLAIRDGKVNLTTMGEKRYGTKQPVSFDLDAVTMPPSVFEYAGLPDGNPSVYVMENGVPVSYPLAALNDGDEENGRPPYTFEQLAQVIQENFIDQKYRYLEESNA